jgi:hypothetical protein
MSNSFKAAERGMRKTCKLPSFKAEHSTMLRKKVVT